MAAAIVMLEMISRPSTSFNIECQKNLNFKILINFGFGAFHEYDRIRARSDLDLDRQLVAFLGPQFPARKKLIRDLMRCLISSLDGQDQGHGRVLIT